MKIVAYCVNMGIDDAKLISGSIQMWYSTNRTLDHTIVSNINISQYQPSSAGGTRSPPAKFKMATRGPKMADGSELSFYEKRSRRRKKGEKKRE